MNRDYLLVEDEKLSCALSYIAHLVFMIAKFLDIPLRYKILANGSRSAVQDVNTFYPLFKTRVDRERFDKACWLLERNVDCLCSVRRVVAEGDKKRPHLLKKVSDLAHLFSLSFNSKLTPIAAQ